MDEETLARLVDGRDGETELTPLDEEELADVAGGDWETPIA
ncbi:MAG: hypothetical protein U0235_18230 [Polyangiaceae bacterium]